MPEATYNYLGEGNIAIEAPNRILDRLNRNFEELPSKEKKEAVGIIKVIEGEPRRIIRDTSREYLSTRINNSSNFHGIDFLRYDLCVQTIWQRSPFKYDVKSYLPYDVEGTLSCFKKIYYATKLSKDKALIHGSLVNINGRGVLIVGKCRSGKTMLTLNFLEKLSAQFISDGNTLVYQDSNQLKGAYLPRPIFVRFSSIVEFGSLATLLSNIEDCESTQPFDREALEEIIAAGNFSVDAGLNISRKKFLELLQATSMAISKISTMVFIEDSGKNDIEVSTLLPEYAFIRLRNKEFPKEVTVGNIKHQSTIKPPTDTKITSEWLRNIKTVSVKYGSSKSITKTLLEDLL